jgi:hypothetical protein
MNEELLSPSMWHREDDLLRIQRLLQGGTSVAATDHTGNTVLQLSVCASRPLTAAWLLEYGGADIAHLNIYEKSVWDFVESWAVHDDG